MSTTFVPGRRGGLATLAPVPSAPVGADAPPAAGGGSARRRDRRGSGGFVAGLRGNVEAYWPRMQWTLVYVGFAAYTAVVITNRVTIGRAIIIAALFGLLVQPHGFRWGRVVPPLALYTAWSAIGYLASPYQEAVVDPLYDLVKLLAIALVGSNALRDRTQLRGFFIVCVGAFLLYPGRGALLNWITGAYVLKGRAVWNGVYGNPNDLAAIALLLASMAASLAVLERNHRNRLLALGATGFITFIIVLTQSRGVLVALALVSVGLLLRTRGGQRARAALALAGAGLVIAMFAPSSVWERLGGLGNLGSENLREVDADGSAEQRLEIWKVARAVVADHPAFGVGLGAYGSAHGIYAQRPEFSWLARGNRDAHSTYLTVMAETGLPGLVLFGALLGSTMTYSRSARRRAARAAPNQLVTVLVLLELGLLGFMIAGVWGSYARLNVLYLQLVLIWVTAKMLDNEIRTSPAALPAARAG